MKTSVVMQNQAPVSVAENAIQSHTRLTGPQGPHWFSNHTRAIYQKFYWKVILWSIQN